MGRPGFKAVRPWFPIRRFVSDSGNHFAAELIRLHIGQQSGITIKDPDTSRCAAFVSREDKKVAIELLNIDWGVTGALCGVHESHRAVPSSRSTNLSHRIDASERIGDVGECHQSNGVCLQPLLQQGPVDGPLVASDRKVLERGTRPSGGYLPRDKIGMMLHLRDQNDVSRAKICRCPGTCDQINPFGRSSRKDYRFRGSCSQKSGCTGSSIFVEFRSASAQGVNAPMNVCVILSIITGDLVDHTGWMLG